MGKSEKKRHSDKKRSDKDSKRRKRDDLAGADEAKIDLGLPDDEVCGALFLFLHIFALISLNILFLDLVTKVGVFWCMYRCHSFRKNRESWGRHIWCCLYVGILI